MFLDRGLEIKVVQKVFRVSPYLETLKYTCLERCCTLVVVFKFLILNSKAVFHLVTHSLKMAFYHDRQTAPPSKCSFKPSLKFHLINPAFVTPNSLKKLICVQHRGRCAELARRATLWCFPNELFVQSS
jgi:hypothetical protein